MLSGAETKLVGAVPEAALDFGTEAAGFDVPLRDADPAADDGPQSAYVRGDPQPDLAVANHGLTTFFNSGQLSGNGVPPNNDLGNAPIRGPRQKGPLIDRMDSAVLSFFAGVAHFWQDMTGKNKTALERALYFASASLYIGAMPLGYLHYFVGGFISAVCGLRPPPSQALNFFLDRIPYLKFAFMFGPLLIIFQAFTRPEPFPIRCGRAMGNGALILLNSACYLSRVNMDPPKKRKKIREWLQEKLANFFPEPQREKSLAPIQK